MWSTHTTFTTIITNSWSQPITAHSPIHHVNRKLKRLKSTLRIWNSDTFKNIHVEMEEAAEALNAIQSESAILGDTDVRLLEEINCTVRLNAALSSYQINSTQSNMGNIQRLQIVLSAYGNLSGKIYNPAKSKVYYGSAVPRQVQNFMHRSMGISHGSLPLSYLWVPIFIGAPRVSHLAPLADSIISRFAKWKGHSLSLACRKFLINSVIAASLVHSMMVYYWPRTLLKKVEISIHNFLWSGDITRRNNSCTVSWARVCAPLEEGGLGVRSIRHANDSFICKLAWDILCNKTLDISLLHDRYITVRGRPRFSSHHSSIWPSIRRHLGRLMDGSRWTVGQSSGISF
ncbi:hypothetical protein ACS0TY_033866 [Phlomoides rotata]